MKARAPGVRFPLSAPDIQNLVSSAGSRAPVYEAGGRTFESCTRYQQRVCGRRPIAACKAVSARGHGGSLNAQRVGRGNAAGRRPSAASNPSAPTNQTGLAQLAERRPPKPKVRGSTPWSGARHLDVAKWSKASGCKPDGASPASVRIGSSSPGLVSSVDESSRLLPGGSAVRVGHEAPDRFPDSADGRAPGC